MKTEGAGTVINTTSGSKTELLGTLYPVVPFTAQQLTASAFINKNSRQSLICSLNAYALDRNLRIQVREVCNGITRDLFSNPLPASRTPLFVGYPA